MKMIYNRIFLEHETGMHPETPKRLECLGDIAETPTESGEQYLELFHTTDYIEQVRRTCLTGGHLDADTITSPGSFNAAIHAVGATIQAARQNDFAICRPPGHHAHPSHSSGFCLFNNVAVAAQLLANEGKRVLIIDIDGHLGDGTVKFFYESNQVMYWSLHQSPAFPGGGEFNEFGAGEGLGYTINVPLPPGSADDAFLSAVDHLLPYAEAFKPDVVAISAGFDSHQNDLLLELRFSTIVYHMVAARIRERFDNVFATLEGGYNIVELPRCIRNFIDGMNGETPTYPEPPTESDFKIRDEVDITLGAITHGLEKVWGKQK